jgi:tetratricopeptide (TPR) repeat protein
LAPPLPSKFEQLEPQLRAYIAEQVTWVKQSPREARRHATLGLVYAANGLWAPARQAFDHAVRLDRREPLARLYLAVAAQELGREAEALNLLRQLTEAFPEFAPGQYRLGDALLRAGDPAAAGRHFQRLQELAPQEWRGFAGLGECRLKLGAPAQAALLLERAVELEPAAKPAHHLLGQAYQRLGRLDDAQRELRLGLNALHYPMPDAWSVQAPRHMKLIQDQIEMAREYAGIGQPARSIAILEAALAFNPTNLSLLNNLAIACNQAGQPQRARMLAEQALLVDSRYLPARMTLSASCLAAGLIDEAMVHAERALELAPNMALTHVAKANVLLAQEADAEALAELEAASRCDPQNAQLYLELGDVCLRNLDRPTAALDHYRKALEQDPTLLAGYLRLAQLHLHLNQTNEARAALEAGRKIAPSEAAFAPLDEQLRRPKP